MVDKKLSSINKKYSKTKSDFSCQFSGFDNNKESTVKNYLNKTTQTVQINCMTNTVACQIDFAEKSLFSNSNMKNSKLTQTNTNNTSICCQTESVSGEKRSTTCDKGVQTSNMSTLNDKYGIFFYFFCNRH